MAIVVADGTGLINADSYISTSFMVEFASSIIGYTFPNTLTQDQLENYAKSATNYLDTYYKFKGKKLKTTQALSFPRTGIVVDGVTLSGIPNQVKQATVCFAIHGQRHGFLDQHSGSNTNIADNSNRLITKTKRKVGAVETEDEYSNVHSVYSISKNSSENSIVDPSGESYISRGEEYLKDLILLNRYYLRRV